MIIEEIDEQIKKKQEELDSFKRLKEILGKPSASLDETILRKYLELKNVAKVASWLNEKGYRTQGKTKEIKYVSDDISRIINNEGSEAPSEIKQYAQKMYDINFEKAMKWNG